MPRFSKINWKRLWWAVKEELYILLAVIIIAALFAIPFALIFLTGSRWWFLLYPVVFFIGCIWEKYERG